MEFTLRFVKRECILSHGQINKFFLILSTFRGLELDNLRNLSILLGFYKLSAIAVFSKAEIADNLLNLRDYFFGAAR
jgi:hypothetical protein